MEIKSSYEKFGKFITKLEQTTRLIAIEEITLNNGLERIRSTNRGEQLQTQDYSLIISTISLNKIGGVNNSMQKLISNESEPISNTDINEKTFNHENIILDTTINDTFQSMIAEINKDTSFPIYKSNPDSLIINENIQLLFYQINEDIIIDSENETYNDIDDYTRDGVKLLTLITPKIIKIIKKYSKIEEMKFKDRLDFMTMVFNFCCVIQYLLYRF